MRFLIPVLLLCASPALAADLVKDERRYWSDGSPQEVWTYDGDMSPENLVLKELFWEEGGKRSRAEFVAGVQHGPARTWHESGHKHVEETWKDGGLHGTVVHWPDPREDKERKKQLKPMLEATWEDGKEHGVWREWENWGEYRWMTRETHFQAGLKHGVETLWHSKDSMSLKHSFAEGELDGKQLGWTSGGTMEYQANFVAGQPHGPQRKYEGDRVIQELHFKDGLLHGEMVWLDWQDDLHPTWADGITSFETRDGEGRLKRIERSTYKPDKQTNNGGRIQFFGSLAALDRQTFDDAGHRTAFRPEVEPRVEISWHPTGFMKSFQPRATGEEPYAYLEFHDNGVLWIEEPRIRNGKKGTTKIYDRQGRLVQQQEWNFDLQSQTVTVWRDDGTKAAEGNIDGAGHGRSGRKSGEWTYWTEDGRLLRTETYGLGPYSGNRQFIKHMVEYDEQERPLLEGPEGELLHYTYDPDDPELVRIRRTVKLLDRSRFGVDSWDGEAYAIVRKPVDTPTELVEGAKVVEALGTRGVVLLEERFRSDGSRKSAQRWNKSGVRHGTQEGWHRDGAKRYVFEFFRGDLRAAQEWNRDGAEVEPRADRFDK